MKVPVAEIELSADDVRALIAAQHPKFSHLSVTPGPSGWDNAIFRLGDELAVRLPRRAAAAALLENEQRWLPVLAPQLPLAIPAPLALGAAQGSFAWRWSITPWFAGETLDQSRLNADQALALADFLHALHVPAPDTAPRNPWRTAPLARGQEMFELGAQALAAQGSALDARHLRIWEEAVRAPLDTPPTWIHGDLHGRNVLVREGRICAVIDWGDLSQGDRACDLAATWNLLPAPQERAQLMSRFDSVSEQTWRRARGWALLYAVNVLRSGDPDHVQAGRATLQRLREGP